MLAQYFHGYRTLSRNHIRVIEWMNKYHPLLLDQLLRVVVGVIIRITMQHGSRSQATYFLHLDWRCSFWHHDQGRHIQTLAGQCHALGMVSSRSRYHAPLSCRLRQVVDLVVSPAQLEREHALHIFPFQKDRVVQPLR